jgi:hypothetical protein
MVAEAEHAAWAGAENQANSAIAMIEKTRTGTP